MMLVLGPLPCLYCDNLRHFSSDFYYCNPNTCCRFPFFFNANLHEFSKTKDTIMYTYDFVLKYDQTLESFCEMSDVTQSNSIHS